MSDTKKAPENAPEDLQEELKLMQEILLTKERELAEANNTVAKANLAITKAQKSEAAIRAELEIIKATPEHSAQMAELNAQIKLANYFVESGAFRVKNAAEAIVLMRAGKEMGLKEIESMQALCIINGTVSFWGDKMLGHILKHGYKVKYIDEDPGKKVTVKIYNAEGEEHEETAYSNDPQLSKSQAFQFAPLNKLRFHAIRRIASFHLPHLFGSVTDEFTRDFVEARDAGELNKNAEEVKGIQAANSLEELEDFYNENKAVISKDVKSMLALGKRKKELSLELNNEQKEA